MHVRKQENSPKNFRKTWLNGNESEDTIGYQVKSIMAACFGFSAENIDKSEDSGVMEERLVLDFAEWKKENSASSLQLIEREDTSDDGTSILNIELSKDHDFKLLCPSGYPHHEDHFYVEAEKKGVKLWANALNEYLLDASRPLGLKEVLDKAVSLAASASKDSMFSENSDEDMLSDESDIADSEPNSDDEDCGMGSMDEDETIYTTTWDLKIARKRKRWAEAEEKIRQEIKDKENIPGAAIKLPASSSKQIFTSSAASGILTNELVILMEAEAQEPIGLTVEAIDDNIYKWQVKISDFDHDRELAKDMVELNRLFGYDYIELQLEFAIDLYPFYPPLVKLVRPRLQASMMQRVTNMDLLKLSHWNPARDMKSILLDIKTFLQLWGRVDLSSERNDREKYPSGSFVEIEHHLLRLALVSETNPRANIKLVEKIPEKLSNAKPQTLAHESPPGKDPGGKKKRKREYWKKGVGYGHEDRPGNWDVKAYMAAQKEKDNQIEVVLHKIVLELKSLYANHAPQLKPRLSPRIDQSRSPKSARQDSPTVIGSSEGSPSVESPPTVNGATPTGKRVDPVADMFGILDASALVPFLETYLNTDSFLEINRHINLYRLIIDVVREIALLPQLLPLLLPLSDGTTSLYQHIQKLERMSTAILTKLRKAGNGTIPKPAKKEVKDYLPWCADVGVWEDVGVEFLDENESARNESGVSEERLAWAFTSLHRHVKQSLEINGYDTCLSPSRKLPSPQSRTTDPGASGEPSKEAGNENTYMSRLRPLQTGTVDINAHHFLSEFKKKETNPNASQMFRIAQEVASLPSSLPIGYSSSVFIRSDEAKLVLMTALITGPSGTPYSGGCFQFDIYFPIEYPRTPPKVNLRTTGNGAVRFNPNLYNCGRVCLSLLGTWSGQKGEQWNATSTVLQILVSIQSLILVSEPFFNEPGFETQIGTPEGKAQSDRYNHDIRQYTLRHAVLDQLKWPSHGYSDAIKIHFYLKRDALLEEYDSWVRDAKSQKKHQKTQELVRKVRNEFTRLKLRVPKPPPSSDNYIDCQPSTSRGENRAKTDDFLSSGVCHQSDFEVDVSPTEEVEVEEPVTPPAALPDPDVLLYDPAPQEFNDDDVEDIEEIYVETAEMVPTAPSGDNTGTHATFSF